MKILLVDRTSEAQAELAKIFDNFDPSDLEALDLSISLAGVDECLKKLGEVDVLIIGPSLGDDAQSFAHTARAAAPTVEMIMFVSNLAYSRGLFRGAHAARVRKVLPMGSSSLDLLQELVRFHEEMRVVGKARDGRLTVVLQAKGGVGVTTAIAALGELCSDQHRHTLLWDFDIETHDLSRSLNAVGPQSSVMSAIVSGERPLNRESLADAYVQVAKDVSLLPPPDSLAAGLDLVGQLDGIALVSRICDLARINFDNVIVDLAGRMGPAAGTLIRAADSVVIMIEDSVLGLSAVPALVSHILPLLPDPSVLRFVGSGIKLNMREIALQVGKVCSLPQTAWSAPAIPFDVGAARWAGLGKTLYSTGQRGTRKVFEELAAQLGLLRTPGLAPVRKLTLKTVGENPFAPDVTEHVRLATVSNA